MFVPGFFLILASIVFFGLALATYLHIRVLNVLLEDAEESCIDLQVRLDASHQLLEERNQLLVDLVIQHTQESNS